MFVEAIDLYVIMIFFKSKKVIRSSMMNKSYLKSLNVLHMMSEAVLFYIYIFLTNIYSEMKYEGNHRNDYIKV